MIIEFTGLPGAGKTTSESAIISCYEQRGFRVILRTDLRNCYKQERLSVNAENRFPFRFHSNWLSDWKGLITAGLGGRIFREILAQKQRMVFLLLGEDIRLSNYFLYNHALRGKDPSVYIPQEGFVHHSACIKVWTGGGFGDLPEKMLEKFTSENFLILYFRISVEDALERLLQRGVPEMWPSHINSPARIKEILFRFNEAIEDTVQKFQTRGVHVLTIDASLDPEQMEIRIREAINLYLMKNMAARK